MKPQSCKAKGRNLQKFVCETLLSIGRAYGLEDGDITSRSMGANGVDVILSPAALRVFNLAIECKNRETLNVPTVFAEHFEKYKKDSALKLLIHKRNHSETLVTLRWSDFLSVVGALVEHEQGDTNREPIGFRMRKK